VLLWGRLEAETGTPLLRRSGSVLAGPQNAPWVRFAVLADPAGASFTASQFVAENR
jgi:hypothetical protein